MESLAEVRLNEIGQFSLPGDGVTRLPFTNEHRLANRMITDWMHQAGMNVHLDAAGTLIGRIQGQGARRGKTLILGSHQDSVHNGGRFDGIMGILLACLAVENVFADDRDPDYSIEIHAYADEEGVRFPTALIGPRALAGSFNPAVLEKSDAQGISIEKAITDFGGQPDQIEALARNRDDLLGYLELHIEQGPVLEQENLATGIVTSICGIERNLICVTGKTGHAGTVPMHGRRDALVPAAKIIAETHRRALEFDNLRATIGTLSVLPCAVNQIPEVVSMSLEIRSPDDGIRDGFRSVISQFARGVVQEHDCAITLEKTYEQTAQACDPHFISLLQDASLVEQGRTKALPSGATHDASAMAILCPIGMLFVRCSDGVSHVPEEYASAQDMNLAIAITTRFLRSL